MKTSSPAAGGTGSDWCDMSAKCRCRWRWANIGVCSKCHDKLQHRGCGLSSTFLFFLSSVLLFSSLGMLFAWLAFSPYKQLNNAGALGCQPDNEGSWSIGVYKGSSPFALQPIEMANEKNDKAAAWPVANPVFTCASVTSRSYPSNFVADPFLYIHVRIRR